MTRTRRRPFIVSAIILAALAAAGLGIKGFVVARIRSAIEATFHFDAIKVIAFPPALVIDGVRSVSTSPSIIARRVEIQVPFSALFRREKAFRVFIDGPVVRFRDAAPAAAPVDAAAAAKAPGGMPFPVAIESGVIRDGEIQYTGRMGTLSVRKIKAAFRQDKDSFSLRLEAAESSFLPRSIKVPLTGRIRVALEGRGSRIEFRQIDVQGKGILVRAQGSLTNPENPEIDLQARVRAPTAAVAGFFNLPFVWGGQAIGRGRVERGAGRLDVRADFESDDFVLNSFALGRAEGTVVVGPGGGRVDVVIHKGASPAETAAINFGGGKVSGTVQGFPLDPILHFLNVPYPVRSPAWGDFTFENKKLRAHAEFRDELAPPSAGRYSFRGPVDVTWDGAAAAVAVTSKRLEASFGVVEAEAALDLGRSVKVGIKGEVSDVRQAREFTSLLLKEPLTFPEIRGRGQAEVKILGRFSSPEVKIDFAVAPGGFDRFDAASASGSVEVAKGEVTGIVKIEDPEMRGEVRLSAGPNGSTVRIRADEASLERVLPPLKIPVPLQGRAAGEFTIFIKGKAVQVAGSFTSESAALAGQALTGVRGMMTWSDAAGVLAFPDFQAMAYGGRVRGAGSIGFKSREFDLDLTAEGLDLSALVPSAGGQIDFTLKGKGSLDKDAASGPFSARHLKYAWVEEAAAAGNVVLTYRNDRLDVRLDGALDPGRNEFHATFDYSLPDRSFQVGLKGKILNPDLLVPWKGVQGELNYLLDIKGGAASDINGVIDFKGAVFPIPNFAHALNDFSGLIRIQNDKASIRSFQAKLGGGDVTGSGEIKFGPGGLTLFDIRAEGRNLLLSPIARTRALVDGSLRLLKDETRFTLTGDLLVKNLSWRRELSDALSFSSGPLPAAGKGKGFFDDLTLDVRVRADGNATLENALGWIQGRFDLTVTGGIKAPVILGDIEGLRGDVTFQDRKFRVLRARLSFFNPTAIEPYLDFQGETYLKDYRVTFSLSGLVDRLRPEFTSSPPLPPEDVLALLALGESFKRTYSYDTSSQMGTGSLISAQLVEDATKRAERLFSLDQFRIDPFVLGASTEMTARLTVGKNISRNIMLLYSTNLTSQREEIVRLEWEFSDIFSLVGMRNELGRISFDAKIRMRF